MELTRPFKIDLQISRRRQSTAYATARHPARLQNSRVPKKHPSKKMITLTMTSKQPLKPKIHTNPENPQPNNQVNVSQFTLQQEPTQKVKKERHRGDKEETLETKGGQQLANSVRYCEENEQNDQWWNYFTGREEVQREKILYELRKTDKKLKFFVEMLNQKKRKLNLEKQQRISIYQDYLLNISRLYQQEIASVQLRQKCKQQIKERKRKEEQEDAYRNLRYNINRDGKRGLNFTPKSVSVFSGASETILISYEDSIRRGENFSFGSSKKAQDRTFSASKDSTSLFLNPGRACVSRRRLDFQQL